MIDYIEKVATAWFVGFFPLAEIYIAVPLAMALGLDSLSSVLWPVFGNFSPVLLIEFLYEQLLRFPRIRRLFKRLRSERVIRYLDRWGGWFVFIMTPWTGVWAMAITLKFLGMKRRPLLVTTFISILIYAVLLLVLVDVGVDWFTSKNGD
ncbi:small multi-drug export protein [Phormidium yuhuli AB48]|uniref:Small multi-drug export protein n=1 Tax=Phormidium yuhuli AB48 TaxID=2940671 RepID=A0ABY5AQ57_9CYAN|nr:small multi-drug export protein [Phormidium yuhuli]USR90906.1 small multi-drug export protein [Phormidium yuhuli AB48]